MSLSACSHMWLCHNILRIVLGHKDRRNPWDWGARSFYILLDMNSTADRELLVKHSPQKDFSRHHSHRWDVTVSDL